MPLKKPALAPAVQRLTSKVASGASSVSAHFASGASSVSARIRHARQGSDGAPSDTPTDSDAYSTSFERGGAVEDLDDSRSDVTDPYVEEVDDARGGVGSLDEVGGSFGRMGVRRIHVEVSAARDLMAKGLDKSSDPFCILEFDGKQKRTSTKVDDLNPFWNEQFHFTIPHADTLPHTAAAEQETLEITVYSRSRTKKHNGFLGRVKIPISYYGETEGIPPRGQEVLVFYPLEKRSLLSRVKGELGLKLWYEDVDEDDVDSVGSIEGPGLHSAENGDDNGGFVSVYAKDKPRGGMHQQGNVAHVVTGVNSPFDLVDQVEYLFVRVLRARSLVAADSNGASDPYVKIHVGDRMAQTKVVKHELNPEWNEVFAFKKAPGTPGDQNYIDREMGLLELTVWDEDFLTADDFLGQIQIPLHSVPTRVYPDKAADPQWCRLEKRTPKDVVKGDIMIAVWFGTQADEAFASSWQSDTGGVPHFRSKSYATPRLWYLRVTVLEAQSLTATDKGMGDPFVKLKLGNQEARTKWLPSTLNPVWKEDLFFVVAEPFDEPLVVTVADFNPYSANDFLGQISIPIESIETRITNREVGSRWYALDRGENRRAVTGRLHLRMVFEGGYHVNDGSVTHNSDSRPTAKQLWQPPIATLELGIIGAAGLPIMKTNTASGGGATDAYVVAKHGKTWVRTRTVKEDLRPLWNEQYTWDVHEPSTVLTIGVFDNQHTKNSALEKARSNKDKPMGKVRIRLSTLEGNKVYRGSFPLFLLSKKGVTPNGSLDLAIRFTYPSPVPILRQYLRPVLPAMHYLDPIGKDAAETLRVAAMNVVADRLARYDPPLRREVVEYMLDTDETLFTMRRIRANWNRIKAVFSGVPLALHFFQRVCQWKSPPLTLSVHGVYIFMVLRPHFILPTILAILVARGAFYYQHRPQGPASMDPRLSGGEEPEDEVDDEDEDDNVMEKHTASLALIQNPYRNYKILKGKFDKMKSYAALVQNILGQVAAQGERLAALLEWRDPRASMAFCSVCLVLAVFLFFAPIRYVAILVGCFIMRHPRFRNPLPPAPVNLFMRLPSLEDRII